MGSAESYLPLAAGLCTHVNEEELHLNLCNPAAQTLPGTEPKAKAFEIVDLPFEPAGRVILQRSGENLWISPHSVEP